MTSKKFGSYAEAKNALETSGFRVINHNDVFPDFNGDFPEDYPSMEGGMPVRLAYLLQDGMLEVTESEDKGIEIYKVRLMEVL